MPVHTGTYTCIQTRKWHNWHNMGVFVFETLPTSV